MPKRKGKISGDLAASRILVLPSDCTLKGNSNPKFYNWRKETEGRKEKQMNKGEK